LLEAPHPNPRQSLFQQSIARKMVAHLAPDFPIFACATEALTW
jgi:hypothetical protein